MHLRGHHIVRTEEISQSAEKWEGEKKVVECGKAMEIEKWVREGERERDRDPLSFHRL